VPADVSGFSLHRIVIKEIRFKADDIVCMCGKNEVLIADGMNIYSLVAMDQRLIK